MKRWTQEQEELRAKTKNREFAINYSQSLPSKGKLSRSEVVEAADHLFKNLYKVYTKKFKGAILNKIYKGDISSYLKDVIVLYSCSTLNKRSPQFRIVRDGYNQLSSLGKLENSPRNIVIEIDSPEEGHYSIPDHMFSPSVPGLVKRIWVVTDPDFDVAKDQPVHHENCFLEDKMHDWDYHTVNGDIVGIRYHGMLRGTKGKLLVEFK
jgi:hypothetical protein